MSNLIAVSREVHGDKKWLRFPTYQFVAKEAAAVIVGAEIPQAAPAMPLVFIDRGGQYELSALLSLASGQNMFVAPDGRWIGTYIPASFRAFPFRLHRPADSDQSILCIDEQAIAPDGAQNAEPFFDANGDVAPTVKVAVDLLTNIERNHLATSIAVSSLAQAGVIKPWPIKLRTEQGERTVNGLNCIDEAALNNLPGETFLKLRATGALAIAYGQLLSMSQLGVFATMAKLQRQLAPRPAGPLPDTLDKLFDTSNNEYLRFD